MKIDILFVGLLFIPIVISAAPVIRNKLVTYVKTKPVSIYPLPISVYLIYSISIESSVFGVICLAIGYCLFFFTYAASISLLASAVKERTERQ